MTDDGWGGSIGPIENAAALLARQGLIVFGIVDPEPVAAPLADGRPANRIALIGNAGPDMWRAFAGFGGIDDLADPLDRWVRRVVAPIAGAAGACTVFPSEGPPYWPFIRWASDLPGISMSPLGPLVHETYGPWFAFRAALAWHDPHAAASNAVVPRSGPCPNCADKPCLDACPTDAITRIAPFDVERCRTHVAASPDRRCATTGCLARQACPVGRNYIYEPVQAAFHMAAFSRMAKADKPA